MAGFGFHFRRVRDADVRLAEHVVVAGVVIVLVETACVDVRLPEHVVVAGVVIVVVIVLVVRVAGLVLVLVESACVDVRVAEYVVVAGVVIVVVRVVLVVAGLVLVETAGSDIQLVDFAVGCKTRFVAVSFPALIACNAEIVPFPADIVDQSKSLFGMLFLSFLALPRSVRLVFCCGIVVHYEAATLLVVVYERRRASQRPPEECCKFFSRSASFVFLQRRYGLV